MTDVANRDQSEIFDNRGARLADDSGGTVATVSVIIVTWNCRDIVGDCLDYLAKSDADFKYEVIVVDNNSSDGTVSFLRARSDISVLVASGRNLGFGAGNNLGAKFATGDLLLLLNPDAYLTDSTALQRLVEELRCEQRFAAIGPQLLNVDGSHQVGDAGHEPSLLSMMNYLFFFSMLSPRRQGYYINSPSILRGPAISVGWLAGTCLLIRARAFRAVGGFDDQIFMYGEDVELGARLSRAGLRLRYDPSIKVTHLQGATQKVPGQLYVSTKWIDAIYRSAAISAVGRKGERVLSVLFVAGFTVRGLIYAVTYAITGNRDKRDKVRSMLAYTSHVIRGRKARSLPQ